MSAHYAIKNEKESKQKLKAAVTAFADGDENDLNLWEKFSRNCELKEVVFVYSTRSISSTRFPILRYLCISFTNISECVLLFMLSYGWDAFTDTLRLLKAVKKLPNAVDVDSDCSADRVSFIFSWIALSSYGYDLCVEIALPTIFCMSVVGHCPWWVNLSDLFDYWCYPSAELLLTGTLLYTEVYTHKIPSHDNTTILLWNKVALKLKLCFLHTMQNARLLKCSFRGVSIQAFPLQGASLSVVSVFWMFVIFILWIALNVICNVTLFWIKCCVKIRRGIRWWGIWAVQNIMARETKSGKFWVQNNCVSVHSLSVLWKCIVILCYAFCNLSDGLDVIR